MGCPCKSKLVKSVGARRIHRPGSKPCGCGEGYHFKAPIERQPVYQMLRKPQPIQRASR